MLDKKLYPFKSNFLQIDDLNYNFVNEGEGDPILMVHGNPTWSFYYRDLIKEFSHTNQVIAPDHIGCGLSSKPQSYEYTLENHIQNLTKLIQFLDLKNITLIVHDWGGAIGFGAATRMPERFKKAVILNTGAFHIDRIPKRIALCKLPILGPFIVKYLNAFAYPATFMTTVTPLAKNVKAGYLHPYQSFSNRKAVVEFVQDIPMDSSHRSYETLKTIESKLKDLSFDKLILWGSKDFCFNDDFFVKWKEIYPEARHVYYKDAGHYVIEDKKVECIKEIRNFL